MHKKIMAPLDGSKLAECVFPQVESLVKAGQVGEVVFTKVAETYSFSLMAGEQLPKSEEIVRFDAEAKAAAKKYVQAVADRMKNPG